MSLYMIAEPMIGAPMVATETRTFATSAGVFPPVPLGFSARGIDKQSGSANVGAGVFIACAGSNVTAIGNFVHISNNSAVLLNTTSPGNEKFFPIGVAAGNLSATNVWGWVQVQGIADYCRGGNSSVVAGARIYLASTAGHVGTVSGTSSDSSGWRIQGIISPAGIAAANSLTGTYQLARPFQIGQTASN